MNMARNVCNGWTDHNSLFKDLQGSLLMSGVHACDSGLVLDMVKNFMDRQDMSTILLTSQGRLLGRLAFEQEKGTMQGVVISRNDNKNFCPMYGMNHAQIRYLIRVAAESMGCSEQTDRLLTYLDVILEIVSKRYPVCLQTISNLLQSDNEFIYNQALAEGVGRTRSLVVLERAEEGATLRKIIRMMEDNFSDVASQSLDGTYNFMKGVDEGIPLMAFYQPCEDQKIMNTYLKEEIHTILKKVPKIRVILHNAVFTGDSHGLLEYLVQAKERGQVELVVCTKNVLETFKKTPVKFPNICMFRHGVDIQEEARILDQTFGRYTHYYPKMQNGKIPAVIYRIFCKAEWIMMTENRLRVRPEDLICYDEALNAETELLAVKTAKNIKIRLVPVTGFLEA